MSCEIESPSGSCLPFNREIPATETRKLPTPDSLHSKEGKAKRLSGEGLRFIQVSELQCIEMTVQSILLQQFIVGSIFHDLSAVDHQYRSEEHTSELQSRGHLVCRLLLEKKNTRHRR